MKTRQMTRPSNGTSKQTVELVLPMHETVIPLRRNGQRDWAKLSDDKFIVYVQQFINENRIKNKKALQNKDYGLYETFRKRGLLRRIKLETEQRNWSTVSDEQLIDIAKKFIKDKKIKNRSRLKTIDIGLHEILRKRWLLPKVKFQQYKKNRNWKSMNDEELVAHAQELVDKKRIKNRSGLHKEDGGLDHVLRRRKLINKIRFEKEMNKRRKWSSLNQDELINYTNRFILRRKIKSQYSLIKQDIGLYQALRRRKLMKKIKFQKERQLRNWNSLSNNNLVEHAKEFIKEKGIETRTHLKTIDSGLHEILRKRRLLDLIFSDMNGQKHLAGLQDIIEALAEFRGEAA